MSESDDRDGEGLRWKLIERLPGEDYHVFLARRQWFEHPQTGKRACFSLISCPDWVNVIAVTDQHEIVLVEQYRHGTDTIGLEIPGGVIDPGETPAEAARRELLEETGYGGGELSELGSAEVNPAIQDNRIWTYLVRGASLVGEMQPDDNEHLRRKVVPLATIPALLATGAITHALVLAAFAQLAARTGSIVNVG